MANPGSDSVSGPRWLAPAALAVVAVIALLIIASGGGSGSESPTAPAKQVTTTARKGGAKFYVVKQGDTLSAIAMKTGVSVETLQQLNPDVDVQALQPGARLQLRQ